MQPLILAPSLLSANFLRLAVDIEKVLEAGADWLHYDVMDNHFVPNLSFGPQIFTQLRNHFPAAFFDVHLMIEPVEKLALTFADLGADLVSFHPAALQNKAEVHALLTALKLKTQTGLVFSPDADFSILKNFDILQRVDLVLVMGVFPGFAGQSFIPETFDRIKIAKTYLDDFARNTKQRIRLEVDGGVNQHNISALVKSGVDTLVAGSFIFQSLSYPEVIKNLRQVAEV